MTSINSLFDWLLEPIFEKLPRKDRLICKMVCQRWYRILMDSRKFRDDRHIYLKNCVINVNQAPASIFINAVFPYEILTISYSVKFKSEEDLNQFAEHLGSSVAEVIFDRFFESTSVFSIINKMPLLKSLTVPHSKVHDLAMDLIRIRQYESDLLKLDVLKVNNNDDNDETPQTLERNLMIIKLFIQKSVEVIVKKVILRENSSIEMLFPIFVAAKVNKLRIHTAGRSNEEMEKLLKVDLSCESIRLICSPTQSPYSFLETFSNVHPNVKKFTLGCYCLPPKIELPRLTKLVLTLQIPVQSLKSLESLTNLKKLKVMYANLDNDTDECGFGHDAVNITNLKDLDLGSESNHEWSCTECMEALAHSFDSLTRFDGSCKIFTVTLNSMFYNWKFLKNFRIYGETIIFDEKFFSNFVEPRVALEVLTLFIDEMILTVDAMKNLFNVFPNLRSISIFVYDSLRFVPSFQNIVQVIIASIKNLDYLYFSLPNNYKLKLSEMGIIVEQLEACGYPVDNLPTLMSTLAKLNYTNGFNLIICHRDKTSTIDFSY